MPISYPDGTVAEHTAVRTDVGVFDVSHLGKLAITGPGAAAFVSRCFTADLDKIGPGQAQYTLCCNAAGGVLDDVIVYLVGPDEVLAVPNAANAAHVARLLRAAAPVRDHGRSTGTGSSRCSRCRGHDRRSCSAARDAVELDYMAFVDRRRHSRRLPHRVHRRARLRAAGALGRGGGGVGRAGGGRGAVRAGSAPATPCAPRWAIRSTARTSRRRSRPVQAGSGWAVGWGKPEFWGRDALVAEKAAGPRGGCAGCGRPAGGSRGRAWTCSSDGARVGVTTSGTFSPTLKAGIALALLDAERGRGRGGDVDVRGRALPCVVTKPPFVPSHVR